MNIDHIVWLWLRQKCVHGYEGSKALGNVRVMGMRFPPHREATEQDFHKNEASRWNYLFAGH